MTTMNISSPNATAARSMLRTVGQAARWVRETPAPRWEGDAGAKATFAGYVGLSVIAWTLLGLGATAILGGLLSAIG